MDFVSLIKLVIFGMIALVVILIVVFVKMQRRPKKAMKKMENAGDLRGKTYKEICNMFGKPSSVSIESDGNKSVYWRITNGYQSWSALAKDTTIYAIFDRNEKCLDYSYESNRN